MDGEIGRLAALVSERIDADAGHYYGDRTGACDRVNGVLALVADRLGYAAEVVTGYVDDEDEAHVWTRIDGLQVDLAGQQFGLPRVHVFASHSRYHVEATAGPAEMATAMYPEDLAIVEAVARATGRSRPRRRAAGAAGKGG